MIKTQVEKHEEEKKKIVNVVDLIEEGSHCSDSMIRMMREHENKLLQLEKKRNELDTLNQVASQNSNEIQKLERTIQVMKHQKAKMDQIKNNGDGDLTHVSDDHDEKVNVETNPISISTSDNLPQPIASMKNDQMKKTGYIQNTDVSDTKESMSLPQETLAIDEEKIHFLEDEIVRLKQKLLKNEKYAYEIENNEKQNKGENKLQVPTTVTLNHGGDSNSKPLSEVLTRNSEMLSNRSLKIFVGGTNLQKKSDKNFTSVPRSFQGESKELTFSPLRQIAFENRNYDNKRRKQTVTNNTNQRDNKDSTYIYYLGRGVQQPTLYHNEEEYNFCKHFCGGTVLVQFLRNIFGKQKDPIVRQW